VNGIRNKYWEDDDSVVDSVQACLEPMYAEGDRALPVLGSGMWAGQAPETWRRIETADVMYIAGGGIQAHPSGPAAGVRSIQQAWAAAQAGIPLSEYAEEHPELRGA
jgi:ribulose-bisphosphate carboxylase large chain